MCQRGEPYPSDGRLQTLVVVGQLHQGYVMDLLGLAKLQVKGLAAEVRHPVGHHGAHDVRAVVPAGAADP